MPTRLKRDYKEYPFKVERFSLQQSYQWREALPVGRFGVKGIGMISFTWDPVEMQGSFYILASFYSPGNWISH